MRLVAILLCLALMIPPAPARADEGAPAAPVCHEATGSWLPRERYCIRPARYSEDVCAAIDRLAARWNLPSGFFARLIWQESRFDPNALSPAGAQGIAQFIPSTARLRGLRSSYDPSESLARSAEYLAALRDRFGNLGLAAAAYNGGEGAVSGWLADRRGLAAETRAYVRTITGLTVEDWRAEPDPGPDMALDPKLAFLEACENMAAGIAPVVLRQPPSAGAPAPWGILVAQHASEDVARSIFTRLQKRFPQLLAEEVPFMQQLRNPSFGRRPRPSLLVGRQSEDEARTFCRQLTAAGGTCTVRRN